MSHSFRNIFWFILTVIVVPSLAVAQSKRMVLIEEGTNASCGPCAAQNPFFEFYLSQPHNQERIIPIIWHSSFPGRDVMNAANRTMHNARVSYNGISGVPGARVNGRTPPSSGTGYAGAPADTVALSRAVTATPVTSPITIDISQEEDHNSIGAQITVSSSEELTSKKLYVAVVEGHHYYDNAGSNGERDFHYIARQMLPSETGTIITVEPGSPKTIHLKSAQRDPEWNAEQMYIVAWVQDDGTKEVLQAATSRGMIQVDGNEGPRSMIASGENGGVWDLAITPNLNRTFTVTLEKDLPEGWNTRISIDGNELAESEGEIELTTSQTTDVTISILPSSSSDKKGVGQATLSITGPQGTDFSRSFRLYSDDLQAIVLQRDEGRAEIPGYYDRALRAGDYVYAIVDPTDEDLFNWKDHVVIMEVGKWALEVADVAKLRQSFDAGGVRLYLIGAEIGFGLGDSRNTDPRTPRDEEFMRDYLHATYENDANSSPTVSGVTGDPVSDGLSFSIKNGVQNQDTPDEIAPVGGAVPVFYYGSSETAVAGIRYADASNRLVYLGFGAEGIGDEEARTELLKNGIAWLLAQDGTTGIDENQISETAFITSLSPNPTTERLEIHLSLNEPSRIAIELTEMNGKEVLSTIEEEYEAGRQRVSLNLQNLSAGLYLLTLHHNGQKTTRPVIVVK